MVNQERGSALLVALVTVLVVTMSMLLVASFIHNRKASFEIEERNVMIATLVDSAMAESLAELSSNKNYRGFSTRELGRGKISAQVKMNKQGYRKIHAVGSYRLWSAVVDAEVDVRGPRPIVVSWLYRQGPAGAQ